MLLLRAPYILTMDGLPLKNSSVLIEQNKIILVGPEKEITQNYSTPLEEIYLKDSVLLPGFVNAHAHLELTSLRDFPYAGNFTGWIQNLMDAKTKLSEVDHQRGLHAGIQEVLETGTTTIADHVSFNSDLTTLVQSPLRGILFVEVLGVKKEVAEEILKFAENFEEIFANASEKMRLIASPHSAHALEKTVLLKMFQKNRPILSVHLAESAEEDQLFRLNQGPLHTFMNQRDHNHPPFAEKSSLQFLAAQNLLSQRILAIHCNYVDKNDIELISQNQMSVVHCPSSHAYFSHQRFPLEKLVEKKINIALGTDSLASGNSLSMLDQIRLARRNYLGITAEEWLKIATLGGAKALKMDSEIGSITVGKKADFIAFKIDNLSSVSAPKIFEAILEKKHADFSMINGQRIL